MKIFFTTFLTLLIPSYSHSATSLEIFLMELQYRDQLLHPKKNEKLIDPKVECPKRLLDAQKLWLKNSSFAKDGFLIEGEMEKSFSKEKMLTMKNTNIHGVLGKMRGNDTILVGGFSYGSSPSFPHTYPGCEEYFNEEVFITDRGNLKCRDIKFSDPNSKMSYRQSFCQDSTKIYIDTNPIQVDEDPKTFFNDRIHCP